MARTVRFCHFLQNHYGWTDGRTDTPSYRDARTHLKILKNAEVFYKLELSAKNRGKEKVLVVVVIVVVVCLFVLFCNRRMEIK